MSENETKKSAYDEHSIRILKGLEAVRVRPGMYIGSTGSDGLHHMIYEIVDNSIDEAMAGYAKNITVTLFKDGSVQVEDDGRGIPVKVMEENKKSALETVFTELHAGGKFDNNSYAMSGGLHGVGASVVNALSTYLKVWVKRDNKEYYIEFKDGGIPACPIQELGIATGTGTRVLFFPDFTIMENLPFEHDKIANRLKQLAYLNKGVCITFIDENINSKDKWIFNGGILEYVEFLNDNRQCLNKDIIYGEKETLDEHNKNNINKVRVEFAMQYCTDSRISFYSFCNNINTTEGGTHEEGFKFALVKTFTNYNNEHKIYKNDKEEVKLIKDDVLEGLSAILSIKDSNPIYEGQTKKKLGNPGVRQIVSEIVCEQLEKFLLEHPEEARMIIEKVFTTAYARIKGAQAREVAKRKTLLGNNSLPGKLADCSTSDPTISEIYLVEGDSAGGSAKLGRDREYQAILPLRGKIMNVEKASREKIFDNEIINNLIVAIGTGVAEEFDLNKLRYNKIIIMTDADVDGAHIRILLLTFLYRFMRPLIENGHVFIAQPPLYKIAANKSIKYVYTDQELENVKQNLTNSHYSIQRYKGLGEMNPEQLWETTMDPEHRVMLKVNIEDGVEADRIFALLMSDDVPPRREFIQQNATYVKNIDA